MSVNVMMAVSSNVKKKVIGEKIITLERQTQSEQKLKKNNFQIQNIESKTRVQNYLLCSAGGCEAQPSRQNSWIA